MRKESLTKKYRPHKFKDMIGQEQVVQMLENGLINGGLGQATIHAGERGSGKTTSARIVAKGLNCVNAPTASPCGVCEFCSDNNLLIFEIDAARNRSVEQIRNLEEGLRYMTHGDDKTKVYIIDEAHMLTTEACNALLKTLEEPPKNVMFILCTTEPQNIIPTIHSRCQTYEFKKVPVDTIAAYLDKILKLESFTAYTVEGLRVIAEHADGSVRDALKLLEQCMLLGEILNADNVYKIIGTIDNTAFLLILKAINYNNFDNALSFVKRISDKGIQPDSFYKSFLKVITSVVNKKFYLDRDKQLLSDLKLDVNALTDIGEILQKDMKDSFIELSIMKIFRLEAIKNREKVIFDIDYGQDKTESNEVINTTEEAATVETIDNPTVKKADNSVIIRSNLSYKVFESQMA